MVKRQELAGVRVDHCDLAEALREMENYLDNGCLNVVETINMKTIAAAGEDERVRACLEEMDLVIPSDREILLEMGVTEEQTLSDTEGNRYLHGLLQTAQERQSGIFLLARTEEDLDNLAEYLEENYDEELPVCGGCVFEEVSEDHDVINEINSVAPQIILAMLPTPMQEQFIHEYRQMINAALWFGIGTENDPLGCRNQPVQAYRRLLARRRMKRQILSYSAEESKD